MKFFLDTANVAEIKDLLEVIDKGDPTLYAKAKDIVHSIKIK